MAGYIMTAWVNPRLNARVTLRYSVAIIPLCVGLWYYGVTNCLFLADSTVVNTWLIACAYKFWKECRGTVAGKGATASARSLFWASIWQLPTVLGWRWFTRLGCGMACLKLKMTIVMRK
ncbi:hypothetical protein V1504DRAFT_458954 [Lipomyces starkeyi]